MGPHIPTELLWDLVLHPPGENTHLGIRDLQAFRMCSKFPTWFIVLVNPWYIDLGQPKSVAPGPVCSESD